MRKINSKQNTKKIRFSLEAVEAKKVSLVGEFNKWNPDADPMQKEDNGTLLSKNGFDYKNSSLKH